MAVALQHSSALQLLKQMARERSRTLCPVWHNAGSRKDGTRRKEEIFAGQSFGVVTESTEQRLGGHSFDCTLRLRLFC